MNAKRLIPLIFLLCLASCKKEDSFPIVPSSSTPISESAKEKEEIRITLNYNYGGEENKIEALSLSYQEPYELPIPEIPSSLGDAVFEGWYYSNKRVETKGDSFPFSSSITLYAHYSHNDFDGIENSSNGITITSIKKKVGNIIIPQYYNGKRVTELASSLFMGNKKITSLVIPDGVEKIGEGCFLSCPNLREVHLPKSLKTVKSEAFSQCKKLKKVYYNGDLSSWLNIDFDYDSNPCCNLASLYFSNQLVSEIDVPNNIKRIKDYAFSGVISLTSVSLSSITSIGEEAFHSCRGLKSISLPDSLTEIGENAFSYCTVLTNIVIPSHLKVIPSNAFSCCFDLEDVILGEGVEAIEDNAFLKCYALKKLTFSSSLKVIEKSAFESCTHLLSLDFPSTLETIESTAFAKCQALTKIEIPSSISSIGNGAFEGTYKVESRSVHEGNKVYYSSGNAILEKETKRVIAGCKNSFLPADTLIIGQESFFGCTFLKERTLPENVITIEDYAFSNCRNLLSFHIGSKVTKIGKNVFTGANAREEFTVDTKNTTYSSSGNCLLSKDGTLLYYGCKTSIIPLTVTDIQAEAFYFCSDRTSIIIPDSVKRIGERAFSHCYSLKERALPDNVEFIGESIFDTCFARTKITFGNGITSIPSNCLKDCDALTSIALGNNVTEIGSFAFYRAYNVKTRNLPATLSSIGEGSFALTDRTLTIPDDNESFVFESGCLRGKDEKNLYFGNTKAVINDTVNHILPYAFYGNTVLENLNLPDSVETIGESAFARSFLSNLVLPSSIRSIDSMAFAECERLTDISYQGTKAMWNQIDFGDSVFSSVPAESVICEDFVFDLIEGN
mgnify:CR=1 FL=1